MPPHAAQLSSTRKESLIDTQDPLGFPEDVRDDVDGLMWLGHLEHSFDWCGHRFTIRTLKGDEELLAGLVTKDYQEIIGQDKAYTWATVALALVSVDDEEDFCPPIGRDKKAHARARFQYVTSNWYWRTAVEIFTEYANLLQRQNAAVEAMEDFSNGSRDTPPPFADSLTDRASSEVHEVPLEILGLLDEDDSTPSESDSSST